MSAIGRQQVASGATPPPVDPAAWVRAAAAGDAAAWDRLVSQYDGLVWAVARSFRLSSADAADVAQTTWLRLVEHLGRIEQGERVSAWLVTTARRECLALLRRQSHQAPTPLATVELVADKAPALDHALLTGERDSAVWAAFARLSERCQRLLRILVADPPPSYEDVGLALGMPVGSIGPTRGRCLEQLRSKIGLDGTGPLLLEPS
jgi:RNA polymerase sigma factor (sigma-70 family)